MQRLAGRTVIAGAIAAAAWAAVRLRPVQQVASPRPAPDYTKAMQRIHALQTADDGAINPVCRTRLWSHGRTTPTAFVLLHGYTNCPAQFTQFAELLYARGHNVLAPRLAHHGLNDRLTSDSARLTVEDMVALVNQSVDALHGLGERRVMIGFSLGGAMAAWAAQQRTDLDHVVIIAPPVSLLGVPAHLRRLYASLLGSLPSRFIWWDAKARVQRAGPPHAYPRYSTRVVGQMCRLGALLEAGARRSLYAAGRVTVITNPCDDTVDNAGIARVVAQWRRHGGPVHTYALPAALNLLHDLFDPTHPLQQTARIYPQLLEWIDE